MADEQKAAAVETDEELEARIDDAIIKEFGDKWVDILRRGGFEIVDNPSSDDLEEALAAADGNLPPELQEELDSMVLAVATFVLSQFGERGFDLMIQHGLEG